MTTLFLILFLSAAALWFFTSEYATVFGVYRPTCAMGDRDFRAVVFAGLLGTIWHGASFPVAASVYDHIGYIHIDSCSAMVVMMTALMALLTLKLFSVKGSFAYAFMGALSAYWVIQGGSPSTDWGFLISFVAAPVMAFVLSMAMRSLFRLIFRKVSVHMITLSYYMRLAVILSIVLTAFAVGLNWGGFLCGIGAMMHEGRVVTLAALAVVGAISLIFLTQDKDMRAEASGIFADFSIYAVVSVGLSVAVTLLFFSFDQTASLLMMAPVPLSVSALVMAAVAGSEVAQRSRLVDNSEYVKETTAMFAAPLAAFVLSYALLSIIGDGSEDAMVGFVVLAAALLVLLALAFTSYARRQRVGREAMDRVVYAQRQQIYEHSRALSDMELKVVLSENQALHNAVEMKRQEVMNVALSIVEQREFLESLSSTVKKLEKAEDDKERDRLISELSSSIKQRLSYEGDVDSQYFYAQAESLHEDFYAKLSENFPNLTHQEKRLATLLRLGFSSKYIATLMNITPKSVEISRYRLRQKLGLEKGDNLVNFIKSI